LVIGNNLISVRATTKRLVSRTVMAGLPMFKIKQRVGFYIKIAEVIIL
jgi:hypothetical protein